MLRDRAAVTQQTLFDATVVSRRRTRLPAPWRRVDHGAGKLGATYRGPRGYVIQHCGHPTALWPYALYAPDGTFLPAPNGRAWARLELAAREVERLIT